MLDALLVDERVPGDARSDQKRQREASPVGAADRAADEHDADPDEHDADGLRGTQRRTCESRTEQDEHRRRAPRDRIDEAEVGTLVGGREQSEVDELERR